MATWVVVNFVKVVEKLKVVRSFFFNPEFNLSVHLENISWLEKCAAKYISSKTLFTFFKGNISQKMHKNRKRDTRNYTI